MKQNAVTLTAACAALVAVIGRSELLTLGILAAGVAWAVGFIAHCVLKKEEEEAYIGRDY